MINLSEPYVDLEEHEAVSAVLKSGLLAKGPNIIEFEQSLGEMLDKREVIAVANGTCALHLAIRAAGWKSGDHIVTSPYSFIASTNPILQEGCVPDYGPVNDDFQLDLDYVSDAISKNKAVKGLLIPHIFGKKVDTAGLLDIREKYPQITIIEDAAQAIAPHDYGLGVGEQGHIVAYSFHENKVITTMGEGGAVVTNDHDLAQKMRSERAHGALVRPDWIDHINIGFNYRMTDAQAAFGTTQVRRIITLLDKRADLAKMYDEQLQPENRFKIPSAGVRSWFGYYIEAVNDDIAKAVTGSLRDNNIGFRQNPFPPINNFNHVKNMLIADSPAKLIARASRVIMIPLHPNLFQTDIAYVSEVINNAATV